MTRAGSMPAPGSVIRIHAPAKVNLALRILDRMEDGFHRLETLFQAVGLEDVLTLVSVPGDGVELVTRSSQLGPDRDNLVTRAVHAFRAATGTATGLRIRLEKRIPVGAGLGGGSSDAGATLRALNHLHGRPLPSRRLAEVGSELGADVAFFTGSAGYALGEGRGERITPLDPLPPRTLLLGLPRVHVATGPAYGALARFRAEAQGPLPPGILEAEPPRDWAAVARRAVNDFESVVPLASPPVAEALEALRAAGSPLALLSGSGGAVFGLPWGAEPHLCLSTLRATVPGVRWEAAPTLERLPEPSEVVPDDRIG
ncbi:MAG: 4-(cytidine 5'-diphospho)-2-C-methyl-D-erythritol kinase [Gemmatimonadota bacterium]